MEKSIVQMVERAYEVLEKCVSEDKHPDKGERETLFAVRKEPYRRILRRACGKKPCILKTINRICKSERTEPWRENWIVPEHAPGSAWEEIEDLLEGIRDERDKVLVYLENDSQELRLPERPNGEAMKRYNKKTATLAQTAIYEWERELVLCLRQTFPCDGVGAKQFWKVYEDKILISGVKKLEDLEALFAKHRKWVDVEMSK